MADNRETCNDCDGLGFHLPLRFRSYLAFPCGTCKCFTLDELRKRIRACCEAHDELVAALTVCERSMVEVSEALLNTSTDWINLRPARNLARAVIDKVQSLKESTTA